VRGDGVRVESDAGFAVVGRGWFEARGPAVRGDLPADGDLFAGQVDVGPVQAAGAAIAWAVVDGVDRAEAINQQS